MFRKSQMNLLVPLFGFTKVNCQSEEKKDGLKCRPSQLPLYCDKKPSPPEPDEEEPSSLEAKTGEVRKSVLSSFSYISNAYNEVTNQINLDQLKEWTTYLREEDNIVPRTGAIALGGLTGLIFGLRGGFFRRTLYTTAGGLTMASVCYPKEAATYSQMALDDSKKYLTICYNFVYGVKPGDPQKELPNLPSIPTSLTELTAIASDIGKSAKNLILGATKDANEESKVRKSFVETAFSSVRSLYHEREVPTDAPEQLDDSASSPVDNSEPNPVDNSINNSEPKSADSPTLDDRKEVSYEETDSDEEEEESRLLT